MLKTVLDKHAKNIESTGECVVSRWIESLDKENKELINQLMVAKSEKRNVNLTELYADINKETPLSFKITVLRQHFSGTCSCH